MAARLLVNKFLPSLSLPSLYIAFVRFYPLWLLSEDFTNRNLYHNLTVSFFKWVLYSFISQFLEMEFQELISNNCSVQKSKGTSDKNIVKRKSSSKFSIHRKLESSYSIISASAKLPFIPLSHQMIFKTITTISEWCTVPEIFILMPHCR